MTYPDVIENTAYSQAQNNVTSKLLVTKAIEKRMGKKSNRYDSIAVIKAK